MPGQARGLLRAARLLAVAGGLAAASGCWPVASATSCTSDRDCPSGYECDPIRHYCLCQTCTPTSPGVSNVPSDLLCASSAELVVANDVVVNTDLATIGGVAVAASREVEQGDGAPSITVFSFARIELQPGSRLRVVGSRALALLACSTVDLAGIVDVSATGSLDHVYMEVGGPGGYHGGVKGQPGGGPCSGQAGGGGRFNGAMQSTGGGGGGHGGVGGAGGPFAGYSAGAGGAVCGEAELIPLRGGSGGAGQVAIAGSNPSGDHLGVGGGGGGAVQITAGERLDIRFGGGVIAAGGGGGQTGNGGGAGGGAGGAILLEAPVVTLVSGAILTANGGGGAAGDCD
ncbi:MAG: hypothetical protein JXR83_09985 [Deltaproteobacteria bacterium]|nr:hypothetical protein [Deltaproteobacteria bacterium]